jgi:hypothetical protein
VNNTEQKFILGHFRFKLQSNNTVLLMTLSDMLPTIEWQSEPNNKKYHPPSPEPLINLDAPIKSDTGDILCLSSLSPAHSVAYLVDCALKFHQGMIWLEGAGLVDKNKNLILVCGASQSGKTTLSLALASAFGWKIISEDLILVNPTTKQVVPFARPLGLRPDSIDRILKVTDKSGFAGLSADDWYFDPQIHHYSEAPFKFSQAILLNSANIQPEAPLSIEEVSMSQFLRDILPIANCVRVEGAIDLVNEGLQGTSCFIIKGGNLKERLEFLESPLKR